METVMTVRVEICPFCQTSPLVLLAQLPSALVDTVKPLETVDSVLTEKNQTLPELPVSSVLTTACSAPPLGSVNSAKPTSTQTWETPNVFSVESKTA
jgi:hypothetical protein